MFYYSFPEKSNKAGQEMLKRQENFSPVIIMNHGFFSGKADSEIFWKVGPEM